MKRGDRLAWTETAYKGTMNGISSVHRFGVSDSEEHAFTLCGVKFPRADKRSFPVLSSLHICGACEAEWLDETVARESAA